MRSLATVRTGTLKVILGALCLAGGAASVGAQVIYPLAEQTPTGGTSPGFDVTRGYEFTVNNPGGVTVVELGCITPVSGTTAQTVTLWGPPPTTPTSGPRNILAQGITTPGTGWRWATLTTPVVLQDAQIYAVTVFSSGLYGSTSAPVSWRPTGVIAQTRMVWANWSPNPGTVNSPPVWGNTQYPNGNQGHADIGYLLQAPDMSVSRSASPIADGGSDDLGNVATTGQSFLYDINNAGTAALDLTGTPIVSVAPGTGSPTVNVTFQPATPVAAQSLSSFEIQVTPVIGAFDFTITIDNSDPTKNPYDFVVSGIGFNPNQPASVNLAAGSSFGGGTNGPFTLSVDPGATLANAALEATDPESDTISVTSITPPLPAPTGITPPSAAAQGHPLALDWTGTADASNPPGVYTWVVTIADAGIGTPVQIDVSITINDRQPEHTIQDALSGNGSPGTPYFATFTQGDTGAVSVDLAAVTDPNTSQPLNLGTITPGASNPAGGAGITLSLGAGLLTATPGGTLVDADRGVHSFDVEVTDGTNTITIAVEIEVLGIPPTFTSVPVTTAVPGTPYTYTAVADGTPAPTLNVTSTLPAWLAFNAATGELSGTPTNSDAKTTVNVTITATNGVTPNATQTFMIQVDRSPDAQKSDNSGSNGCAGSDSRSPHLLAALAGLLAVLGLVIVGRRLSPTGNRD
jgi:hypothetical protein